LRCSPSWAAIKTRPNRLQETQSVAELKQLIADCPQLDCAAQRDRRGREQHETQPSQTPSPFPVIPAKAGIQQRSKRIEMFASVEVLDYQPNSLPATSSSTAKAGAFGNQLFEFRGRLGAAYPARASFDCRPLWRAAQGTPARGAAEGAFLLWLLSFGQAKESDLPPGNPRPSNCPHKFISGVSSPCLKWDFLIFPTRSPQDASAISAIDRLLHFPGRLFALHDLQNLMLQEHAVQADSGKYVLEFDPGGEHV
jgi:hypothetical protein